MELLREERLQGFVLRTVSVEESEVSPHVMCEETESCEETECDGEWLLSCSQAVPIR